MLQNVDKDWLSIQQAEVVAYIFQKKKRKYMLETMAALNPKGYKTRNGKEFVILLYKVYGITREHIAENIGMERMASGLKVSMNRF
jgi:hypothetical protein